MTAEFAMILPAVAVVLALAVGVVQLGAVRVALTDAAADAARILGRGDSESLAASRVARAQPGAQMSVEHLGSVVCVTARAEVSPGLLGALFSFDGRGCALDDTTMPAPEPAGR
ncbi:hypothetical protein N1027_01080 [Herbiconiux sp. CPCC 205763]|uniref:Pilus assembly protein TadE n=1 Tax=Herbiconiux aconitum TaxID=2970913 RepID=A0ABT2GKH7_9MICO|nr:TadE family type IV pilus minor pilin [Herbiconiux aconitum]MCS5716724.1 hypothetical protein [Herbiconiux aconitum]